MPLTTADLRQVRALLHRVRDKWYNIGIELEINVEELNIINGMFDDPGDKLTQMLIVWLKQQEHPPTWSTLAKALMAEAVYEVAIAEEASALEVAPPPLSPSGLRDQDYDLSTGQTSDSEAQWGGAWATESHTSEEPASPRIGARKGTGSSRVPIWKVRGICSHASYKGVMSSEEAESKLMIQNTDCYLTRYSETREQFTLSVRRKKGTFQNFDFNIKRDSGGKVTYEISGSGEKFTDIAALLDFYKEHPLNTQIDGIGEELVYKSVDYRDELSEPSVRSNFYPCLLQKQNDGRVAFVCKETGRSFLDSTDFMNYCENKGMELEEGSIFVEEPVPVPNSKIHYRPTEDGELLQHFKLDITTRQDMTTYEVSSWPKTFDSIFKLLDYYQKKPISDNIGSLGECVECKFPRKQQERHSSIDLMRFRSGTLTRVTEEKENRPQEEGTATEAVSCDHEAMEEPEKPTRREEIVAKAVPGWKIQEIGQLSCFHIPLDMDEAESRLKGAGKDRCYLMRYSESREEHILSVLKKKSEDDFVFQHFPVAIWDEGQPAVSYEILGSMKRFNSIVPLLEFYQSNPLNHQIHTIGDAVERDIKDYTMQEIVKDVSPTEINVRVEDQDSAVPQWALTAMESHPSFHGSISRQQAVKKLIDSARTCYLTRYSHYNKFCVISMLNFSESGELLQHLELQIPRENSEKVYKVAGKDKEFDSISKLLEYYQKHPINKTDCLGEHLEYLIVAAIDLDDPSEAGEEMRYPTRENLTCITYINSEGKKKDLRLLELVTDKWRKAAVLLAFNKDRRGSDAECCKQIFYKWIKKDGRNNYPLTWMGLHRLLFDMGKRYEAEKLYKVLKYREIKYVDTMSKL